VAASTAASPKLATSRNAIIPSTGRVRRPSSFTVPTVKLSPTRRPISENAIWLSSPGTAKSPSTPVSTSTPVSAPDRMSWSMAIRAVANVSSGGMLGWTSIAATCAPQSGKTCSAHCRSAWASGAWAMIRIAFIDRNYPLQARSTRRK